jgi:hypothetical protein
MLEPITSTEKVKEWCQPLIESIAAFHAIDPRWLTAIVTQESQWNMFAVRYEPAYQYLYHPETYASGLISFATEINTQKSSWGLGQIMGALYREQGGKGFMAELLIPEINLKHIAIRLAYLQKKSKDPATIFAGYNGGVGAMRKLPSGLFRNELYVRNVQKYVSKLV